MKKSVWMFVCLLVSASAAIASQPLWFEENRGQAHPSVSLIGRSAGDLLLLGRGFATIRSRDGGVTLELGGDATPRGAEPQPATIRYVRAEGTIAARTFGRVVYSGVAPGVDLAFHAGGGRFEYDFVVAPGADPSRASFRVRGERRPRIDGDGSIVLAHGMRLRAPRAYQLRGGVREPVDVRFVRSRGAIRFALGRYDRTRALVIDPVIETQTYYGGEKYDEVFGIASDSLGNVVAVGTTGSKELMVWNPIFPQNQGVNDTELDAFVMKMTPDGSLLFATYLGGSMGENGWAVAVDRWDNVYVTGTTTSSNFPITYNTVYSGQTDTFVAGIDPNGAYFLGRYLGGSDSDYGRAIATDEEGFLYIGGETASPDFPATWGSYQQQLKGCDDGYVAKLAPVGRLIYATYLGGDKRDAVWSIAVDAQRQAWAAGATNEFCNGNNPQWPFPPNNCLNQTPSGSAAFVFVLNERGDASPLNVRIDGDGDDSAKAIRLDANGDAYVGGRTQSTTLLGQNGPQGFNFDGWVAKFSLCNLVWARRIRGQLDETVQSLAVDRWGQLWLTGSTNSNDFIAANPSLFGSGDLSNVPLGNTDAYLLELDPSAQIVTNGRMGGSAFDSGNAVAAAPSERVFVGGGTSSNDLPIIHGMQPFAGITDGFVTVLRP